MTQKPKALDAFCGKYSGEGAWTDIGGASKRYRVSQSVSREGEKLLVKYTHEFFEEGSTTSGEFVFDFVCPPIFATTMKGAVVGNGYVFDDYLHFNIRTGEMFVEASYERAGKGLRVRGSSTSNSQGLFIAWSEVLERAS